jgi:hypothetical protein
VFANKNNFMELFLHEAKDYKGNSDFLAFKKQVEKLESIEHIVSFLDTLQHGSQEVNRFAQQWYPYASLEYLYEACPENSFIMIVKMGAKQHKGTWERHYRVFAPHSKDGALHIRDITYGCAFAISRSGYQSWTSEANNFNHTLHSANFANDSDVANELSKALYGDKNKLRLD